MKVKVRRSLVSNNEWGFLESFNVYRYLDNGSITVVTSITPNGELSMPYGFKQGDFVPLSDIRGGVGIERYMKAKKPIYSLLSDGFIVKTKVRMNFTKGVYIPEGSVFEVYTVLTTSVKGDSGYVYLKKVMDVPNDVVTLMGKINREIAMSGGDRVKFLSKRVENYD